MVLDEKKEHVRPRLRVLPDWICPAREARNNLCGGDNEELSGMVESRQVMELAENQCQDHRGVRNRVKTI